MGGAYERCVMPGEAYGWDVRSIYESPKTELMEAEAFYMAFARIHNIDGHQILSILTKVKTVPATNRGMLTEDNFLHVEGVITNRSVLIVKDTDMTGVTLNKTLRVDGTLYEIVRVSHPCGDIVRIELEANG